MADIGFRSKGDAGPMYSPERDYAYITPTLMLRAIENLDPAALSDEDRAWYVKHEITQDNMVQVASALAEAQRDFVNAADPVQSIEHALSRRSFFDASYACRQVLFSSIGVVFCAAWFKAVREVSSINEESPAQAGMARFTATVNEFAARNGAPTYNSEHLSAHLQMRNDVLQARINDLYAKLQKSQRQLFESQVASVATPPQKTVWQRLSCVFFPRP